MAQAVKQDFFHGSPAGSHPIIQAVGICHDYDIDFYGGNMDPHVDVATAWESVWKNKECTTRSTHLFGSLMASVW